MAMESSDGVRRQLLDRMAAVHTSLEAVEEQRRRLLLEAKDIAHQLAQLSKHSPLDEIGNCCSVLTSDASSSKDGGVHSGPISGAPTIPNHQTSARLACESSPKPWEMAAGSMGELLTELGLSPLYGETFAEYGLSRIEHLVNLGRDAADALLLDLGVTRDHRHALLPLAFSPRPCGASGGAWNLSLLEAARPLHAAHMGCENMGPLLYALARFVKPKCILEVGAGYTSLWLLQALCDNEHELERCNASVTADGYKVAGTEWVVGMTDTGVDGGGGGHKGGGGRHGGDSDCSSDGGGGGGGDGCNIDQQGRDQEESSRGLGGDCASAQVDRDRAVLHCVDDMTHEHTTANRVTEIASRLGLDAHLQLHAADAYALDAAASIGQVDMLWLDFGVGVGGKLKPFLNAWWPRIRPGGLLLVHSTLTNAVTRFWLDSVRQRRDPPNASAFSAEQTEKTQIFDSCSSSDAHAEMGEPKPGQMDAMGCEFETLSLLEPHKKFQNSVSIFQRRPHGWSEPLYSSFP